MEDNNNFSGYKISEIERTYPNWYNEDSPMAYDDQKCIWENTELPEEDKQRLKELETNGNANAYENVNGGYKYEVNTELRWPNSKFVLQLRRCTSKDSPKEISRLLQEIFAPWPSKKGHWLWIAQTYSVRAINWQVSATIKAYQRADIKKTPSAYFTFEIGFRRKRKLKHIKHTGGLTK